MISITKTVCFTTNTFYHTVRPYTTTIALPNALTRPCQVARSRTAPSPPLHNHFWRIRLGLAVVHHFESEQEKKGFLGLLA